jgi:hypothetical protein
MDIQFEGTPEKPTKLMIDGQEVQVDATKWEKAYKTVKDDMGLSVDDPNFIQAVCELYASL